MRVQKVNFTGLRVYPKDNKEVKFLYNQVLDVVNKEHLPATFATDYIDLPKNERLIDILNKLKIIFKSEG